MKQITVTPLNAEQTVNYTQRLQNAGVPYRLWKDGSIDRITLSENDAWEVLGIQNKPAPMSTTGKVVVGIVLAMVVGLVGLCNLVSGPEEPPTFQQQMEDQYGRFSSWMDAYGLCLECDEAYQEANAPEKADFCTSHPFTENDGLPF